MTAALPPLNFLTWSPGFTDYRPAVNVSGDAVVFERTLFAPTTLFWIPDLSAPNPVPFLSGPAPAQQTRPDWSWVTTEVAFNGETYPSATAATVWRAQSDGGSPQEIPNTKGFAYPTWDRANSGLLVAENHRTGDSLRPLQPLPPRNSTFYCTTGEVQHFDIDGFDSKGAALFGGMPTVGPANLPQIAFAGQPQLDGWAGQTGTVYNEEYNYIFLNSFANRTSAPMETSASVTTYEAQYQGRAPAWSPDGKKIAFESNRDGGYAIYLCDLASEPHTITQVTDASLGGQHAKFFHCGTKLILCIHHPGGNPETMGIAWVDISGLLMA